MRLPWILILILTLTLVPPPTLARGGDGSPSGQTLANWTALFSESTPQTDLTPTSPALYQTSLTSTYFAPPPTVTATRLQNLTPETEQPRTRGLLSSINVLNGRLVTEAEMAHSEGGATWLQNKIVGDTRDDAAGRMLRLGITGTTGSVRYGALYRSAGQAFLNGPDLAVREVWGEWKSGQTTLRSSVGQQWNNVTGDTTRIRLGQTYGRLGLAWKSPGLPEFLLTYSNAGISSSVEPLGTAPQRNHTHTLEGALAYAGTTWNARLTSAYILGNDLQRGGAESTVRVQTLTAAIRPLNTLTITPTLGYREEIQDWSGTRIESPSASVAVQYRHNQRVWISATGNYASTHSNDRLLETQQVGGKGILAWDLQRSQVWATLLSFEAGYTRLTNNLSPAADVKDISGIIKLILAAH
ncbi:conserved exported hypothetical protein [Nitrospira lenta]|uniref:Uncharacterized protein n=2 Tax=Nitrospira lenta TaxID=1436998 RepID=A0A330L4N6_9BACT|nr:conserved exported hypothetical protein [Nitrospira lenta]